MPGSSDVVRLHNRIAAIDERLNALARGLESVSERVTAIEEELQMRTGETRRRPQRARADRAAPGTEEDRCPVCGLRYNDKRHKSHSERPAHGWQAT